MKKKNERKWESLLLCLFVFSVVLLVSVVLYLVSGNDKKYDKNKVEIKYKKLIVQVDKKDRIVVKGFDKNLNNYIMDDPKVVKNKSMYEMNVDGVNKLMDDYRSDLRSVLGEELYAKYKENHAINLLNVADDGKTIHVDFEYYIPMTYYTRFGQYDYISADEEKEREIKNLITGLTYMYKDVRNVHVRYGYMSRNKYNKTVFFKKEKSDIADSDVIKPEYLFKRDDLSKVENWEDYPFELLMELNEYKK